MKSDIQIAQETEMKPITEVAENFGIDSSHLELYGNYKAKLSNTLLEEPGEDGKLVLVTAINPTPAGEGKTTISIGLTQALNKMGKKSVVALREPSLGPCFGIKGGAAGGGYSQVVPMEDINLHFTGDLHAIGSAHNLLSAMLDNHLQQGNDLNIDPRNIVWKRVVDLNDRALRNVVVGLGNKADGVPREDGFYITVASEVMAIFCLAADLEDLKDRLSRMVVAYTYDNKPVTAGDLQAQGAMTALLKDAIKPNLVQTLEHTPAIIHGGPFANIAHGCNSVRATKFAMKMSDIAITEAGFGSDLGAEKFFDIKCRMNDLEPDAVVLVATARALKYNGGVDRAELEKENLEAVEAGFVNLQKHVENLQKFGVPVIVTLNSFYADTDAEVALIKEKCEAMGAKFAVADIFTDGGAGGKELASTLIDVLDKEESKFELLYDTDKPIFDKIETICKEIYGAGKVNLSAKAKRDIKAINDNGYENLPVCIAKTQYSLSADPNLLGRPEGFEIDINEVRLSAGAGFVVAVAGNIMTMPGLPKVPAANNIDVDKDGNITGLF